MDWQILLNTKSEQSLHLLANNLAYMARLNCRKAILEVNPIGGVFLPTITILKPILSSYTAMYFRESDLTAQTKTLQQFCIKIGLSLKQFMAKYNLHLQMWKEPSQGQYDAILSNLSLLEQHYQILPLLKNSLKPEGVLSTCWIHKQQYLAVFDIKEQPTLQPLLKAGFKIQFKWQQTMILPNLLINSLEDTLQALSKTKPQLKEKTRRQIIEQQVAKIEGELGFPKIEVSFITAQPLN